MTQPDSNLPAIDKTPLSSGPVVLHRTVRIDSSPTQLALGRYDELTVSCIGPPNPTTGYLVDIHQIDDLVRTHLAPIIADAAQPGHPGSPAQLIANLWELASSRFTHQVVSLRWALTPMRSIEMNSTHSPDMFILRQTYEFAASHRLHNPMLDEETNHSIFGKCNNPNGHGHNYRLEPSVQLKIDDHQHAIANMDNMVEEAVLSVLDHKHLNLDCPAFDQSAGGMIPSVENIAKYCYEQLSVPVSRLAQGAELLHVTVWETDRTSCTYPA